MLSSPDTRQAIYLAAVENLEQLQQEIAQEARLHRARRNRRLQALALGGVLLSVLMSTASVGVYVPLHRALTTEEARAIENLCAYVAVKQSVSPNWVQEIVLTRFNIRTFGELRIGDYDEALIYLLKLAG